MSRDIRALVLGSWCITSFGLAGPPLETDDPDTPDPNKWEINLSSPFATRDERWLFQLLLDIHGLQFTF